MKMVAKLIVPALLAFLLTGMPGTAQARVMMTGMINQSTGFGFDILETATFTVDDWLSTPNLWWLTIHNATGDSLTVTEAKIFVTISSGRYGSIIESNDGGGVLYLIGSGSRYLRPSLSPGEKMLVDNTLVSGGSAHMVGNWNESFKNEVLRIGYLPEGTYSMSFILRGKYSNGEEFDEADVNPIIETIEIRNPQPPELVTPENGTDDEVAIPRFSWQAPAVSDLSSLGKTIRVYYTITLWKMFSDNGAVLSKEEAIRRIPIWERTDLTSTFVDFDPGTSREDLISGRKYCWQVQGFDATGRYISSTNEGKSDIWEFSVRFIPPMINEPILFFPLRFSWTGAQAGGGTILYDISIADNQDFSRAYKVQGQFLTTLTYPTEARPLDPGKEYYIRLQATDDQGIPIGTPAIGSFTVPTADVALTAPEDKSTLSSLTPTFRWQGSTRAYVVTVSQVGGRFSQTSGKVEGTSWTYDGEELQRGVSYSWEVAPADDRGDPAGAASEAYTFTIPETTQVTLLSPVDMNVDSAFPVFTWNSFSESDESITYVIEITGEDGAPVHTENVTGTSFKYPETATGLQYGAKYVWYIKAQRNGSDIGTPSAKAWFTTPYVASEGEEATLADLGEAIKLVLNDYSGFAQFRNMTIVSIRDQSGQIAPSRFLEMLGKYTIKSVKAK